MGRGATSRVHQESLLSRKARGAFYTPPELAAFIAQWAVRTPFDRVLEPSCGEGEFLVAVADCLEVRGVSKAECDRNLMGFEVDIESARAARTRIAQSGSAACVQEGDFLLQTPKAVYDAVVGNPPYVRFQSVSSAHRRVMDSLAEAHQVPISKLASLWMPFVLHATSFLKRGGRLGFVLPAELLMVNYASALRSFLIKNFASVRLVTFEEPVFPGVQEEIVLLLAEGWHTGVCAAIAWQQCEGLDDLSDAATVPYRPSEPGARWSGLFASKGSLGSLESLITQGRFVSLEQWGRVALGAVTGNNSYFVMTESEKKSWGLIESDVVPLSPPGSRHLRRLAYSLEDARNAADNGAGVYLFRPEGEPSEAARRYIAFGESQSVHEAYKCRVRKPWWRVPIASAPDAFVTYMNAYGPNICANEAGVSVLNSCHGLYFHDDVSDELRALLPVACLNSATMFGAEITGRPYGGGMLKMEPREAAQLPVPSTDLVAACAAELRAIRPYVEKLLEKRDYDAAVSLVDAVLVGSAALSEPGFMQMKSNATLMRLRRKKRSQVRKVH